MSLLTMTTEFFQFAKTTRPFVLSYLYSGVTGLCNFGGRWSFVIDDAAGAFDQKTDATTLGDHRLRHPKSQPTKQRFGPLSL